MEFYVFHTLDKQHTFILFYKLIRYRKRISELMYFYVTTVKINIIMENTLLNIIANILLNICIM